MKKLIGSDIGAYAFDPAARTLRLTGLPPITLANVLLVTNVTAGGVLLYSFADPALSATWADGLMTLAADTTAMHADDALQVWADVPNWKACAAEQDGLDPAYVTDVNLMGVFGSRPLAVDGAVSVTVSPDRTVPTADRNLAALLGNVALYTNGHADGPTQVVEPTLNPPRPAVYAAPRFAGYPQRHRRLRVQIGGDQNLPLAQEEHTNRLAVATPRLEALLEALLLEQQFTNLLIAEAFNLAPPSGPREIV